MAGLGTPPAERAPLATVRKRRVPTAGRNGAAVRCIDKRGKCWQSMTVAEALKVRWPPADGQPSATAAATSTQKAGDGFVLIRRKGPEFECAQRLR